MTSCVLAIEGNYFIRKESHLMNKLTARQALEMMTGMSDIGER
jgi:para-nitrobenzyl esterase